MAPVIAGFRGPPGTLSIVDAEAYESEADGPMASLTFPVRLSGVAPAGGVWFDALVADGTARAGVDYVVPTQVEYSIPEGQREAWVTVELIGDTVEERSEEHTSELQSLMRISYAVCGLTKKNENTTQI